MNASDLVENWLKDQGFRSERDSDGDLRFRYEGVNLFVARTTTTSSSCVSSCLEFIR